MINWTIVRACIRAPLSFFSLIEPGPVLRLSITHIGLWLVLFILVHTTLYSPHDVGSVLGATVAVVPLVLNYMHQRQCNTPPYGPNVPPEVNRD